MHDIVPRLGLETEEERRIDVPAPIETPVVTPAEEPEHEPVPA